MRAEGVIRSANTLSLWIFLKVIKERTMIEERNKHHAWKHPAKKRSNFQKRAYPRDCCPMGEKHKNREKNTINISFLLKWGSKHGIFWKYLLHQGRRHGEKAIVVWRHSVSCCHIGFPVGLGKVNTVQFSGNKKCKKDMGTTRKDDLRIWVGRENIVEDIVGGQQGIH